MEKNIFCLLICLSLSLLYGQSIFGEKSSKPDYMGGNGTILLDKTDGNTHTVIRKMELEVTVGDLLQETDRNVFTSYENGKKIFKLKDNDNIKVLETCTVARLKKSNGKTEIYQQEVWYKIQKSSEIGWLHKSEGTNPYKNNSFKVLEKIESSGRKWTVRRMNQTVAVWERLNVREKPGLDGNKISMIHDFDSGSRNPQENYTVVAMTEEKDSIDGMNDYWLKIEYAHGKYGWIFGGYATVERGGPKYYTPENTAIFALGWY